MKIGIPLGGVHPGLWRELAVRADELGYESVWLPEHLVLPATMSGSPHHGDSHPPIPPQTPMYDPTWLTLGVLTDGQRVELGFWLRFRSNLNTRIGS